VTYFVLKEKYKENNLYMPEGVLYGSAGLLALGLTVEFAPLLKVGKVRKKRLGSIQVEPPSPADGSRGSPERGQHVWSTVKRIWSNFGELSRIHGLNRFKKPSTAAKVLQLIGCGILVYYFVKNVHYNNQVERALDQYARNPAAGYRAPTDKLLPQ
jgi:hypothetical protein